MQSALMLTGRILIALYFLLPGIAKFVSWERHIALMEAHEMVMVPMLLAVAGIVQIAGGCLLLINRHVTVCALGFAVMVLLINFNLHDFWNVYDGVNAERETQNFVKNMAVLAGLLVLAAAHSTPSRDASGD
jgi:putative oxidoreductase